ncbi:T9SS type A sorting domain-containing protein [Hymenobacter volaticus]|uniref:T9SS type A sorting domain-containing protein n=1 Tax=Hymenobacter volaticus TaxID=2932254 RepID=A0ABY4GET5_9BACT|nr:T9SS type A sorting domain-containing protein [Hymenobacter volaticus]UOQ69326.1 T9SS type A sorting domain-containing protein [Hymenobacter volaticus]
MKLFLPLILALPALPGFSQTLTNQGAILTVEAGATLYVAGGVLNQAGSTLTNAGTLHLEGDLTNAGTFTSPGLLLFAGTRTQVFRPGTAAVSAITLRNTGAAGANRLLVTQDLVITSLLTLTRGLVRTQGMETGAPLATLSLPDGGRIVGEGPGQYVQGRLALTRASVSAATGPVDFSNGLVLDSNEQNLGPVTVTRTAGLHAAGISYGTTVGGTRGIDRLWQVAARQPLSAPVSATVSWISDDDNGLDFTTSAQLWQADQASGPWTRQGAPATSSARRFTAIVTQLGVLTISNSSTSRPLTPESRSVGFTAQLYPNPVRGSEVPTLLVYIADAGPLSWQLTDALGRTLRSQTAPLLPGTNVLPLGPANGLPPGVYLVRIQQGTHHQVIQLIRE